VGSGQATDTQESPWYAVPSDDQRKARLNCIAHFLSLIPYKEVPQPRIKFPQNSRGENIGSRTIRSGISPQNTDASFTMQSWKSMFFLRSASESGSAFKATIDIACDPDSDAEKT
jgi:hypothetical protein